MSFMIFKKGFELLSPTVSNENFFTEYFSRIEKCVSKVNLNYLASATDLLFSARKRGGKILLAGNGGSAAMASHVSVDFVKVAGLRAVNFNEADLITCFANDYGYEHWVEKSIEVYADPNDIVILISSSGKSLNIVNAAQKVRERNLPLITFSGFMPENPLQKLGDINFWAESNEYNVVEMTHHIWLLALVDNLAVYRKA